MFPLEVQNFGKIIANGQVEENGGRTPGDLFINVLADTFIIISADGGVTGTFTTANSPLLGGDLSLDLICHPTFVALEVISKFFMGDANNDSLVTGAGLITVQQNFGNVATAAVPEPTSVCLLTLASLGAMARRRRVAS